MLRKIFSKVSGLSRQKLRNEALCQAASKGDVPRVSQLLAEGADVAYQDTNKFTPLSFASAGNHADVMRLLLEKGANPDDGAEERLRGGVLIEAASRGNFDAVRVLVEAGADISLRNYSKRTALHDALWNGHADIAIYLAEKGAELNTRDRTGHTPLVDAIVFDQPETAKVLITRGADTTDTTKYGEDMRAFALGKGHEDVALHIDNHLREQEEKAARAIAAEKESRAALEKAVSEAAILTKPVKAGRTARFGKKRSAPGA